MAKTVVGIFDEGTHAQMVVDELERMHFTNKNIHVLAHNSVTGKLRSFAASNTSGGGEVSSLTQFGVPVNDAQMYAEGVRRGGTLVAVSHIPDAQASAVVDLFHRHGVVDLERRAAFFRHAGYTGHDATQTAAASHYTSDQITAERQRYSEWDRTAPTTAASSTTVHRGEQVTVPIIEEHLAVGKREVEKGRARIHTHVIETPVQEQVSLREEHVTVERHAVNREVSQADLSNALHDRTIEVRETAEVPVVAKEARVVEEVTVGKQATQHTETIRDTVRRTDVDVDEDVDTDLRPTSHTTTNR
jgi:uncharacterized protein (TIGR02271 family)